MVIVELTEFERLAIIRLLESEHMVHGLSVAEGTALAKLRDAEPKAEAL